MNTYIHIFIALLYCREDTLYRAEGKKEGD